MNKRNIIISVITIVMMLIIAIIPNYCYAATGKSDVKDGSSSSKKKDEKKESSSSKKKDEKKESSSSKKKDAKNTSSTSSKTSDSKNTSSTGGTGSGLGLGDLDAYEGKDASSVELAKKANYIFTVLRTIGVVLSVVILMIIGIKYMLGSVEEKANYKETLLPYIIGAFLLFAGSVLPQIIYNFMQNF